ncbi:glycosyltransferase involved in cell wall biosynthesis [Okibacterium sp. HSC-33S16]|uniref:glycosyltransferase n=1 Tax=Okibacterium sp. HSC-33S16 TaxID=2910965 RepID=UPI00209FD451|nr:glycosyltransferase [Okibacterium sp. HSC-33S16]MCP2031353.1 glycosyltransferase involved in cell wall biosynthesis [Okibacterium sp. HSC-33S16]
MHILMFSDQHADSLGGVQVSIRLQKRFLELAGHRVTVVAPKMHREHSGSADYVDTPSVPITLDREYSATLPSRRIDRFLDEEMATRSPVDIVHVQADYWGAMLGYRFAARHGIRSVHTFHNHMEFGLEQVVPFPTVVIRALLWWQHRVLRPRLSTLPPSAWSYLDELAARASASVAPSGHFARLLESHGVGSGIDVIWTGADDALVDDVLAAPAPAPATSTRPLFVWMGRMSAEKRVMEYLEAIRLAGVDAEFRLYGAGLLLKKAQAFVRENGLENRVVFAGKVPYRDALAAIAAADALVQTSIGFETQGMTVFEAAALGTPSIVSDPNIAGELPDGIYWQPADGSVPALADALRHAAADVASGSRLVVEPQASLEFRQSYQTARMIEVYERVLPASRGERAPDTEKGSR